jgi:hypothetical protein
MQACDLRYRSLATRPTRTSQWSSTLCLTRAKENIQIPVLDRQENKRKVRACLRFQCRSLAGRPTRTSQGSSTLCLPREENTEIHLACLQASPTLVLVTMAAMEHLLGYCAKRPNATQVIRPSPMLLKIFSDASYPSLARQLAACISSRTTTPLTSTPLSTPNPHVYWW